jgi:hypothetical protein
MAHSTEENQIGPPSVILPVWPDDYWKGVAAIGEKQILLYAQDDNF